MKIQIFTLLILLAIGMFAKADQKLHRSPWGGGYNQEDIEDPYYLFIPSKSVLQSLLAAVEKDHRI